MPDITMCKGVECRARKHCYRFMATPDEYRQSWFVRSPGNNKQCEYYYELEVGNMYYNVIDAETGEIYVDMGLSSDASKFLVNYQCRIVGAPDFIEEAQRSDEDIYVIPSKEVV